jgi:putative heme-binding domain-containing protein
MCYLGGAWPEKYQGQLFMGNIHGRRINMDVLKPSGSGYVAGHGPDFLLANDEWARFINLKYGPDGNVYLIDWYDKQACHAVQPEIWDRTNGRIYKVSYRGARSVTGIDLQKCSDEELVQFQVHDNEWYVRHARRILQERAVAGTLTDPAKVRAVLEDIATKHPDAGRRLRGLWALHAINVLDGFIARNLTTDPDPHVRGWAIRLMADDAANSPKGVADVWKGLDSAALKERSPVARRQLASIVRRLPAEYRQPVLAGLLSHGDDATDFNLPCLYWYGLEPVAVADPKAALDLAINGKIPLLLQFTARRIATAASLKESEILTDALAKAAARKDANTALWILRGMAEGLKGRRDVPAPTAWSTTAEELARLDNVEVRSLTLTVATAFGNSRAFEALRSVLADPTADPAVRSSALATLVAARDRDLPAVLYRLLVEPGLRAAAIRALGAFDDPRTSAALLGAWGSFTTEERRDALNTLTARPAYARDLLAAIGDHKLAPSDVPADVVRNMRNLQDAAIAAKIAQIWGTVRETAADRARAIADWKKRLTAPVPTDLAAGRAVFAKTCQNCHMLYGTGGKVGPDITGSNRSNLDYLLENVLDPSAVIPKDYMATIFNLSSGRTVTGIVKGEDNDAFTVQTANETLIVAKREVDGLKHSRVSMMPDNLLQPLTDREVRNLFAYLRYARQVPMLATSDNAKDFFNAKDLTGWVGDSRYWSVQDGELVGKAAGLPTAELLKSEFAAEDFRLTVRIKMTTSRPAGGIHFRGDTQPGGAFQGIRARIGQDAWGQLTDGNDLLAAAGIGPVIDPAGWNLFAIEARGGEVRVSVNGRPCSEYANGDKIRRRGSFALELPTGAAVEVRFKDLRLEVLHQTKP